MLSYAAHRVLGLIPVLATAVVLTFIANQFVPGDPILILLSDQSGDLVLSRSQLTPGSGHRQFFVKSD